MTQYVKNLLSDSTVVNQRLLASKKNVRQLLRILYLKYQSFLSLLMFLRFPSKKTKHVQLNLHIFLTLSYS